MLAFHQASFLGKMTACRKVSAEKKKHDDGGLRTYYLTVKKTTTHVILAISIASFFSHFSFILYYTPRLDNFKFIQPEVSFEESSYADNMRGKIMQMSF